MNRLFLYTFLGSCTAPLLSILQVPRLGIPLFIEKLPFPLASLEIAAVWNRQSSNPKGLFCLSAEILGKIQPSEKTELSMPKMKPVDYSLVLILLQNLSGLCNFQEVHRQQEEIRVGAGRPLQSWESSHCQGRHSPRWWTFSPVPTDLSVGRLEFHLRWKPLSSFMRPPPSFGCYFIERVSPCHLLPWFLYS